MRRVRDESGQVAGSEVLMMAVLLFVVGTLVIANLWALVDGRATADSAAREYLRAWTEATDPERAATEGRAAAAAVVRAAGSNPERLRIDEPAPSTFGPCSPARVRIHLTVPAIAVPGAAGLGDRVVTAEASELVDAHRPMVRGGDYGEGARPCG